MLNELKMETNFGYTENGAVKHSTTLSNLYDMFAMGGAMRNRQEEDIILMFRKAYHENPTYALKCLFYLRDILEGQGERRFFRVCIRDLAMLDPGAMKRNIENIPMFGRWDDLYALVATPCEKAALAFMKKQLILDMNSNTPSLLAKWLKSENTSSEESRRLGNITRKALGMTHRQYRKTLSVLRSKINIVEKLMSENRWDEIEFDKIPSKAGMIYRNAFARHDIERAKSEKNVKTYADFINSEDTKVNAKALYPYEVVKQVRQNYNCDALQRQVINKYWDNLTDYFNNASLNALCVVDTSASMLGTAMDVAVSLGMYCAERAKGPFKNHYISFSREARLVEVEGIDFWDKAMRIIRTNLCQNTNIESVFDLLLNTVQKYNLRQSDLPKSIIIISDMEFDTARGQGYYWTRYDNSDKETLMEGISKRWEKTGYKMPNLVFWNVDARNDNIPMKDEHGITFVSGFSPVIFEMIMTGKSSQDLMFDKLNSERYKCIK